ncbi:hypothetical protein GCM10027298_19960 [Epidermidibacterium keratini]
MALCGVLVAMLSACALNSPDATSWRDDAAQATEEVAGQLVVAGRIVEGALEGRVPTTYAAVAASDVEESANQTAQTFAGQQPPASEREQYDAVTGLLSDAGALLAQARIAIVEGDVEQQLLDEIQAVHSELVTKQGELQ